MAKQIKQPMDDDGKPVYLGLNKAKYITIIDGGDNKYAKTGTQWLVWYDPIPWMRLGDGTEIESKYPDLYEKVYAEISATIVNHRAHVDTLSFKEQKKKKDEQKKELKKDVDKAILDSKKSAQPVKPTVQKDASSNPSGSAGTYTEPKRTSANTSPSGAPVAPVSVMQQNAVAAVQYHGLSESELITVYTSWHAMQGRSGDAKKSFMAKKADGSIVDELDQFMQFGLFHKGVVPDNLIPPLPIIKKLLNGNDDLILYYERKLNKGKTTPNTPEERLKAHLKSGASIAKSSMPKSFTAAITAGKIGLDIGRVGLKAAGGLSNKIGDAIGKMKSPLDGNAGGEEGPSMMSIARDRLMGARGSDTDKTTQYMAKQIGDGLRGIKEVLLKRLPEKSNTRAAENKTFANEAELMDKTADGTKGAVGGPSGGKEKEGSKNGIFGKLAGLFGFLLSPLKLFGKALGSLVGFIAPIGKVIGSILSGLSSALMPLLRAIAPALAVGAAAYGGYKAGQALFKATGTLNEDGSLSQDSWISKMNDKLTGVGNSSQSTSTSKQLKDMSDDELNSLNSIRKNAGKPALDRSDASQKLRDSEQRLRAVSKSTDVTAAPKSNSAIVDETVNMQNDAKQAKDAAKASQPIVVSAPQNNTSVGGSGSPSIAMHPRTSNSTFQRYNDSRTRYSYA